jgi:hypothetical protein
VTSPVFASEASTPDGASGTATNLDGDVIATRRRRRTRLPGFDDRYIMGHAGIAVSPFCIGMVRDPAAVLKAYEFGVNFFFFSADLHWPLYEPCREGLRQLFERQPEARDEVVVAVASYVTRPKFSWAAYQEACQAVPGMGYIDVLVAGAVMRDDPPDRLTNLRGLRDSQFLGCRAIGASFHHRAAALAAVRDEAVDIALLRYNTAHPGARSDTFPHLPQPRKCLLYNFKSTDGYVGPRRARAVGLDRYWVPRVTDHYRFVLTAPVVDGILCAPSNAEEVLGLYETSRAAPLDPAQERHMIALTQRYVRQRGHDFGRLRFGDDPRHSAAQPSSAVVDGNGHRGS